MNDIETATITSLEVAEMTGKIHKNLIRSIETYMKHFTELNFEPSSYFELSTYADASGKRQGDEQTADFIHCVAMGRGGEFAEKYLHQGIKIVVTGRIQTGSYTNKDGQRIYTTDVVVEEQEFAESKAAAAQNGNGGQGAPPAQSGAANNSNNDGFMNMPDAIEEELPFN